MTDRRSSVPRCRASTYETVHFLPIGKEITAFDSRLHHGVRSLERRTALDASFGGDVRAIQTARMVRAAAIDGATRILRAAAPDRAAATDGATRMVRAAAINRAASIVRAAGTDRAAGAVSSVVVIFMPFGMKITARDARLHDWVRSPDRRTALDASFAGDVCAIRTARIVRGPRHLGRPATAAQLRPLS